MTVPYTKANWLFGPKYRSPASADRSFSCSSAGGLVHLIPLSIHEPDTCAVWPFKGTISNDKKKNKMQLDFISPISSVCCPRSRENCSEWNSTSQYKTC